MLTELSNGWPLTINLAELNWMTFNLAELYWMTFNLAELSTGQILI